MHWFIKKKTSEALEAFSELVRRNRNYISAHLHLAGLYSQAGKIENALADQGSRAKRRGIVFNPEPGNNSSAVRKSIDEVASKVGINSIDTPRGDSADIDCLIRSLKDEPNSG